MKKLTLLCIGICFMSLLNAQDLSDALRYSQSEIQGTARFRALSGAFGALGGDMSAISVNPAGSAVFNQSQTAFTASNLDAKNASTYFNSLTTSNESDFDINQGGVVFVFKDNSNSSWRKLSFAITYERTNNFDNNWSAIGRNTNNQSIDLYFLENANGKRLDEISALPDESLFDAYLDIGSFYGFEHQQAFLGFKSFILEPDDIDNDANTTYFSNLADGSFDHDYSYFSRGFNGKVTANLAAQYEENLYFGLNINSHFIDFERSTLLFEDNANVGSLINYIKFENNLSTIGTGFSFQLGGILKLNQAFRVGITYDSPTWYRIEEETTQYLATDGPDGFIEINPQVTNVYPSYRLKTPGKITGSAACVFNKVGLISFDYSIKDYSKIQFKPESDAYFANQNINIANTLTSAATYRVGGEYKVKQFSFRGGYRFEESPYVNGVTVGDLTGYSLGIGYNFGNTRLDFAYDRWDRTSQTSLYNIGLTDVTVIDNTNSNFTLSINFNI